MDRGAIQFLGKVEGHRKEKALLEAHFLVLPTRYPHEGQPLVLIEAMSAGAVPVTTDQGGIPDLMSFAGSERLVSVARNRTRRRTDDRSAGPGAEEYERSALSSAFEAI
jgi:glycosyltransferase involved in cell wall biosynthesis